MSRQARSANTGLPARPVSARTSYLASPARIAAVYGPRRAAPQHYLRDLEFWRKDKPREAAEMEARWRKIDQDEESRRVSFESAAASGVVVVKSVELHEKGNAFEHHTSDFVCTQTSTPDAVFRRGREFWMTITFNRPFDPNKDYLTFIFVADIRNPAENMRVEFGLDKSGRGEGYLKNKKWGARLVTDITRARVREQISVYVSIPPDALVAEWEMKVKTTCTTPGCNTDYLWNYPTPIYVLFNPWSADDLVHFKGNEALLKEYILNEEGTMFVGNQDEISPLPWFYGQFEKDILQICFLLMRKAFGYKMTPEMANPVEVSRALGRIVNSNDDNGVLVGNWTGNYSGGVSPTTWSDSVAILKQYYATKEPVRYGQCFVFAQVLTTVCRALGIPCRSLTNFSSAHDRDNSCTIDIYFDEEGNQLNSLTKDAIWNFHCWNEVWIMRLDLPPGYDGWHALDSTPQEISGGFYQCGPCPVAAVRQGELSIGYDTPFVFSEVNADEVHWVVKRGCKKPVLSSNNSRSIGVKISTKRPNLRGDEKDDTLIRQDITEDYKPKEGSAAERRCVERALRYTGLGPKLFPGRGKLEVEFKKKEDNKKTFVGQDIVVNFVVTNISNNARRVGVTMTARSTKYWDHGLQDDNIAKRKFNAFELLPGQRGLWTLEIPYAEYMKGSDSWLSLFVYGCAVDLNDDMPYSAQKKFTVSLPELTVQGPTIASSGQAVDVMVSFTNPLPDRALTDCWFIMTGNLEPADRNDRRFSSFCSMLRAKVSDVKPGKSFSFAVKLKGNTTVPDKTKSMKFDFKCKELRDLNGDYVLKLRL